MSISLLFLIIGLITPLVVSKYVQFYRKDYTYNEEYDAFYKVHWDPSGLSWSSAFRTCDGEGAKLLYPTGDEWTIVKNLTESMLVSPNTTEMFVGLHDAFNLGEFITIDGKPTESPLNIEGDTLIPYYHCVMMDFTTGQFRVTDCERVSDDNEFPALPFVCKKVDEESCPTIDHEYKYMKSVKKCYKVNKRPMKWQAAMQTCYMEGGVLAVLEHGADPLLDLIERNQYYFVGFKKMFSSEFYTVKGEKFENDFFKRWYNPNDYPYDCGVMQYYNQETRMEVNDCNIQQLFICEMAAQ